MNQNVLMVQRLMSWIMPVAVRGTVIMAGNDGITARFAALDVLSCSASYINTSRITHRATHGTALSGLLLCSSAIP